MVAKTNDLDELTGGKAMSESATADVARQNVDAVQRCYAAVGRGDIPAVLDLLADDVEWTLQGPPAIPFAGTRHGKTGAAQFFTLVGGALEFHQFEPREIVAQGDTVVAIGYEHSLVKPTGRSLRQEWVHVYTLREGKIAGAGLDVFEQEPVDPDNPILTLDNVIVSPHALCWTYELSQRSGASIARSVLAVAHGEPPEFVVNRDAIETPQVQAKLRRFRADA